MKTLLSAFVFISLILFTACKTNTHVLKCPDMGMVKSHHQVTAKASNGITHSGTVAHAQSNPLPAKSAASATTLNSDDAMQIKIPRIAVNKMSQDELEGVNDVFVKYSNNKVQLQRNEKGRIYLRADSKKDFFSLAKTLASIKKTDPSALAPGDTGGRIALAGGIIGIVALLFSLGPFISYSAFLLGLIAIILGAIGLRSSRRGWAIAGIVLGVLAILFAGVLGIGIFTIVLHI